MLHVTFLDEDGVYHPGEFNDRLLLGLKGTMSEGELHLIRARMRGAVLSKAKRGELAAPLPIGLVYNEEGRVGLDPDQQVQQAIRSLFETFRRVGSAFGVVRCFRQEGVRFPRLIRVQGRAAELAWGEVDHHIVIRVLQNPRYAGAYFYGRTRLRKKPDGGRGHAVRVSRAEWHTLILDAHPGYITWEDYEENLRRLQENAHIHGVGHRGPVREGPALLQGLMICGVCGSRMTVAYHVRRGDLVPDYTCPGRSEGERTARGYCQRVAGESLDRAVGGLLVETVSPLALEVALSVQRELQARWEEADRLRRMQVDRARYEADLARRRFLRVDPENRLVAASLEAEWNEKLRVLADSERTYERQRQSDQAAVNEAQRTQILALATNFPKLWHDSKTPERERKRMVRLLIEDVTVRKAEEEVHLHIRFRGRATQTLNLPRPRGYCEARKQSPALVAQIDRLLDDYNYGEVARILNERGMKTGGGLPLTTTAIGYIRIGYGLKSRFDRLREKGLLTTSEIAQKLGVTKETIWRYQRMGLVRGHPYNEQNASLYEDPGLNASRKTSRPNLSSTHEEVQYEAL